MRELLILAAATLFCVGLRAEEGPEAAKKRVDAAFQENAGAGQAD